MIYGPLELVIYYNTDGDGKWTLFICGEEEDRLIGKYYYLPDIMGEIQKYVIGVSDIR